MAPKTLNLNRSSVGGQYFFNGASLRTRSPEDSPGETTFKPVQHQVVHRLGECHEAKFPKQAGAVVTYVVADKVINLLLLPRLFADVDKKRTGQRGVTAVIDGLAGGEHTPAAAVDRYHLQNVPVLHKE